MLTAAVRDLHLTHPGKYKTAVDTSCGHLWENNPYISKLKENEIDKVVQCEYPLISKSNTHPYHFIHGFRKNLAKQLNVKIEQGPFQGDIHLSPQEKSWMSQVQERGELRPFWIIITGMKWDFTAKLWPPQFYQNVVNHFRKKILFVQCGDANHFHVPLKGSNVINLIGKTDLRQFVRLMYHASGVVCPVTFAMHLSAAVESKDGIKNRPTVVLAGGREPAQWEAYPHHRYLSNNGALPCCDNGGCWKSRATQLFDGDSKDNDLCLNPVDINSKAIIPRQQEDGKIETTETKLRVAKCLHMIKPEHVIQAIESYYEGGILKYVS